MKSECVIWSVNGDSFVVAIVPIPRKICKDSSPSPVTPP